MRHDVSRQDEVFRRAFAILSRGIQEKAFPGAQTAIVHRGNLVALKSLGRFTYDENSAAVGRTIYDLASLTKVVATTAMCMRLYDRDQFPLEHRLVDVLPDFTSHDPRRAQVTLRMLLAHTSGLPAYVKLFETAKTREELLAQVFALPLAADPGTRAVYSDIGFILLGLALERIAKEPIDAFCRRELFPTLPSVFIGFKVPEDYRGWTAPTENDTSFRHRVLQGEVHDENAWVLGGVAGHAGCFAGADAVAAFGHCMLQGESPLFQAHTVELFTRRELFPDGTSRALGWDTPSQPSQSGSYFSPRSYGHLGYTGTSLWNDPERRLSVTLLTNRTWPDRRSEAIREIRPAFHDAVIEALK